SQWQSIWQLLRPDKWEAERVSEACKWKNRRLKRGKEGAPTEIEQYCLQREKEFKAKEAVLRCGDRDAGEDDHPQTYFQPNSDEILGTVSAFVCDIRPEIHEHHRIN
ncbi:hypothetical protein PANDA_013593, partial [Ailuropoda melanoleuca]